MYVKAGLAGSNFFFRTYNGFSNRRIWRIPPRNSQSSATPLGTLAESIEHSDHAEGARCASLWVAQAREILEGRKVGTGVTADVGSLHRNAVDVALR